MALIRCPECGKEISDRAKQCPHCGLPQEYFTVKTEDPVKEDAGNEIIITYDADKMKEAVHAFIQEYTSLMFTEEYVTCKEYSKVFSKYRGVYEALSKVKRWDMLAVEAGISLAQIEFFANKMKILSRELDKHNEWFLDRQLAISKGYLDSILNSIDPNIRLDEEQRKVVLSDDDYSLVVAGAGAGKTTTMAAKVKYLVEKKGVRPEEIIVISFTNKAVRELAERINKQLNIPVNVMTFHSFGNAIIRQNTGEIPEPEAYKRKYFVEILKNKVFENPALLKKIVLFFGYYMDIPPEALKFHTLEQYHEYRVSLDYETLKSTLGDYEKVSGDALTERSRTIKGEFMRSIQEVQIANYLFLHGIDYEYEKVYEHRIPNARKMYTPDFYIKQGGRVAYLEHFGISEDGTSDRYTQQELDRYTQCVNDKVKLHKRYGTRLLYTFSVYRDGRTLIEHLEELLTGAGFSVTPRDEREVYRQLIEREKDKYIYRFAIFMETFIGKYKTNGWEREQFAELRKKTDSVRNQLFLEIAEEVYVQYQAMLEARNRIDFEDMINFAEKKLEEKRKNNEKLEYKYIIIDEYQDIARQRFNLTKKLSDICDAKIVAVGDDWQSIYAFSGSDIHLFTNFVELMGGGKMLQITRTYRNSQELIDIAGNFIQENASQIQKSLKSPKHIENPVSVQSYDDTGSIMKNKADALLRTITHIVEQFGETAEILLISRYNFEINQFCKTGVLEQNPQTGKVKCAKYPRLRLTYMTAHSSKGLGFDNVIILNGAAGKFGFPSQIEDDPIMKMVTVNDTSVPYAEERRLFYVALTRTKNRVYILTPCSRPSQFVLELIRKYKLPHDVNINLMYDGGQTSRPKCPDCGYPLKKEYNTNYGLSLHLCTNEPELCDFMTNSLECPKDIHKCLKCGTGYMIVRKSQRNQFFFGCTNYRAKGIECNSTEVIAQGNKTGAMNRAVQEPFRKGNAVLYEALKTYRQRVSREEACPPYVVFTNQTLDELVREMPETEFELSKIKGFGKQRMEHYGRAVLEVIRKNK